MIRTKMWWVRILDFPRLQVAVLCVISLAMTTYYVNESAGLNYVLLAAVLGAFANQVSLIMRFTPLFPKVAHATATPAPDHTVTIVHINVRMENREYEKFKAMVREHDPDLLSINEPDEDWANAIQELNEIYPFSMKKPLANTYGMMLFSKLPLEESEINFLVDPEVPSFFTMVVLPSGKKFAMHCLHPEPPEPGSPTYERDTELLLIGKRIKKSDLPAIVVGDLNDVGWSYTSRRFQKYAGVLDPRQGRGLFNTYNANVPLFRYPLDHFFYTPHFKLVKLQKLANVGSDHFPMLIRLELDR